MKSSDSATLPDRWTCNLCEHVHDEAPRAFGRETRSCAGCGSSVRLRALIDLISCEFFGTHLPLPAFPRIKALRGLGMSDTPEFAELLADKFDYRNTFYHQPPSFDVVNPSPGDLGIYDFVISSEVLEHVPPPPERAFDGIMRLLKPEGILLMTVPFTLGTETAENFPDLADFTLAQLGGKTILVNRKRDGTIEIREDLVFHGGHGSTLEMRRYSEASLREILRNTGFDSLHIAAENYAPFGIVHAERWSVPMAARKGNFALPAKELAEQYTEARARLRNAERDLEELQRDFKTFVEFHDRTHEESKAELARRFEWGKRLEAELEESHSWALSLEKDVASHLEIAKRFQSELEVQKTRIQELDAELQATREAFWSKLGRSLGLMKR